MQRKIIPILIALALLLGAAYFFSVHFGAKEYNAQNVYGLPLQICCTDPITGFYRNGKCHTGPSDQGEHIVCAIVTDAFLDYSLSQGNDLRTPKKNSHFSGLEEGDCWCLTISRWQEANEAGKACPLKLEATHIQALDYIALDELELHRHRTPK